MIWQDLRHEEFAPAREASNGVCVVPIGCVEKHGQHLPLGTDCIWAEELCKRAAEKETAVVFPTIYFGEKTGAGEYDGTIILSNKLRHALLTEICDEIGRNGFKKVLIVNTHGGNSTFLADFNRSILEQKREYMVFYCFPDLPSPQQFLDTKFDYLTDDDYKWMQDFKDADKKYGHACIFETGAIYHTRPELVRLDRADAESGLSTHLFDDFTNLGISTPFGWMGNYPNSYSGHTHDGINERISRAMCEFSINLLAEQIKFLKNETISNKYHAQWLEKQKTLG